jgi:hypothetical protein
MNFLETASTSGSNAEEPVARSDPDSSLAGLSLAGASLAALLLGALLLGVFAFLLFEPHAARANVSVSAIIARTIFFILIRSPSNLLFVFVYNSYFRRRALM